MHKRIVEKSLKTLDVDRANYFNDVVGYLEELPATQEFPNLVYLSLKDILDIAPTYIEKKAFALLLLKFVKHHQRELQKIIYDKEYLYDENVLRKVTGQLIEAIVDQTIQGYEEGHIETGEPVVQKFSYPYRAMDLVDPDDEEAYEQALEEDRLRQATYTGPDRRRS
ncbi:hypothetical protein MTBPR1_40018 [Candidatus Terasakiella magnetica]|uniref:Uncharacterized protein n=1 Tax=Candidatus Terasakiella magnetica TaxID=1867952 RepID=A0A1C3RID0_9PROT|nr:hypothetical protein [Candidatus Terasakiella magnetica]SCA56995.1 hypothetical protein MTBPR1_40018 [Candidatus Terasakiella magnetica]